MTSTPDEAVNLEAAVERLEGDLSEPFGHFAGEEPETCALVRIADAKVVLSALSASNARALAAEEALRWRDVEIEPMPDVGLVIAWADGFPEVWDGKTYWAALRPNAPPAMPTAEAKKVTRWLPIPRTTLATMGGQTRD